MSESTLISLQQASVSYCLDQRLFNRKKFFALDDISFDLHHGDSLGVIGRNGCGKSTLLQLMAGVMEPDSGSVVSAPDIRINLLSLQLGFVEYLTGIENAILNGMYLGMDKSFVESRLNEIIEFSELGEFIHQPLYTYSSGMRARLGFAVAFQLDTDIMLVDEVLGVGDAEFRDKSFRIMKDRLMSKENTIVFVSHAAGQIRALCNKAVWLEEGNIELFGEVNTVVDAYEASMAAKDRSEISTMMEAGKTVYLRQEGSKTIYSIQHGKLETIHSWDDFKSKGGRSDAIKMVSKDSFSELKRDLE